MNGRGTSVPRPFFVACRLPERLTFVNAVLYPDAMTRPRRLYVVIGRRSGWCGHHHGSLRGAVACYQRFDKWRAGSHDRWICGLMGGRRMPTGERLAWLISMADRPVPILPLECLSTSEMLRMPRGVRCR